MTTLTEIVAAVVVHSSTAALSHFGVMLEPAQVERPAPAPAAERVVARSPRRADKVSDCPQGASRTPVVRA
ncbi:hypothetical protein [Phenylobacterium hankyongense]|uniref:hypothetical protein n=1 Tax=Phenylobacterium hankyongense TaxID=1813876 RepID=UPI0014036B63|nr:hypothetical protein [Phenylobacterium hankyongense]